MPIFDYYCAKCDKTTELVILNPNPVDEYCLVCDTKLTKLIGTSVIQFKGYGFPGNDMKRKKARGDLNV